MIACRRILPMVMSLSAACSMATDPGAVLDGSFSESAKIRIDSTLVRTIIVDYTMKNVSGTSQAITWTNDCSFNSPLDVRMYRGTTLVWESTLMPPPVACSVAGAAHATVLPDQDFPMQWSMPVRSVLGDSLAEGTYTFSVRPTFETPAFTRDVDAGQLKVADPVAVPPGTNLDGTWTGSTSAMSVSLALTWTADSVNGSGTYQMSASNGGRTGTVTLRARRTDDVVMGGLNFDFGYEPPYSGRLKSATEFDGTIMNVDTPGTPLTLTRSQ